MAIQFAIFFSLAFVSGLFYPIFFFIIGAPKSVPDVSAGPAGAQFVKTMVVTKPGQILRRYGAWLCRMQNRWEQKHDKSLLHEAILPEDMKSVIEIGTSYNREETDIVTARTHCEGQDVVDEGFWRISATLLPGEQASVVFYDCMEKRKQVAFQPLYPNFDRIKMPLSIFKAMGLCGGCTSFWLMLANLLAAFFMGMFPGWFFWFITPAYGLAIWASQQYEI